MQKVAFRSSPKPPLKIVIPGVLLALIMVAALSFAAVAFLKNARTRHQGGAASPSATASPLVAGTLNPVPTTISSPRVPVASATPASSPSAGRVPLVSATPASSPSAAPISRPTALVKGGAPTEAKTPSASERKTAEQRRREAERKRARLEAQHKDHQISDEAYKQGQHEYQAEMAKYRDVVAGGGSANKPQ